VADYMMLVGLNSKNNSEDYMIALSEFIKNNINIFQQMQPTIDEVIKLHEYIIEIHQKPEITRETLFKLKETFFDNFTGDDLLRLFDYGISEPSDAYKELFEKFLSPRLNKFFEKSPSLKQVLKLESLVKTPGLIMAIKSGGLNLVSSVADYMMLVGENKNISSIESANFIRYNISVFKKLRPTIDEVMALHSYVVNIKFDDENIIFTLLKIKEAFIGDYDGVELIRLLDYGMGAPSEAYIRQLGAFKKQQGIGF
jgi:hypothetical protein